MSIKTLTRKPYCNRVVLCLLLLLSSGTGVWAEPVFKVGFVVPSDPDDPFFSEVLNVMQAAARDLNIELITEYAGRSMPMYAKRRGLKLMKTHKPGYFLTGNWPGAAKFHLLQAEEQGIKSFVINTPFDASGDASVGAPRKTSPNWLGQMTPDNRQASYLLADILIREARKRKLTGPDGKVHLIALSGNGEDTTSLHRLEGLETRVEGFKDAALNEVVLAGWQKETAYRETIRLLELFPHTSVVWAASDHMAQGAAEAAEELGKKPGGNIMIGGFDWNDENLRDIGTGRLTASIGGHVFEGAWALVLLYDYHKGIDFARELDVSFQSSMYAITTENIGQYSRLPEGVDWDKVDFTRFSKALNPKLKGYDFSLSGMFDSLGETKPAVATNNGVDE